MAMGSFGFKVKGEEEKDKGGRLVGKTAGWRKGPWAKKLKKGGWVFL
jgi:hypothetical protein